MNAPPIRVTYGGKLVKARTRDMIDRFFKRFFTPFAFVIWGVVAFEYNTCMNVPALIVVVSLIAAVHNANNTYLRWRQDLMLISEGKIAKEDCGLKATIAGSDFLIHFISIVLGFWWVDDFHECLPVERANQGVVWAMFVLLVFVLHSIQYHVSIARQQHLVTSAYQHCHTISV